MSTSSKKFVDGKTRSKSRRELNRKAAEEAAEEQDRNGSAAPVLRYNPHVTKN